MVYCFDLDNTLCFTDGTDYENAEPNYSHIEVVNLLKGRGNTIWIHTGRGSESGIDWRELTECQLRRWGVKYDKLYMGKLPFHVYVDDLAYNTKDFFRDWLNDNITDTTTL